MSPWLKEHGPEWAYRILVLVGLVVIGWLNQNYATRAEVIELNARVSGIETAIKVMVESNKVNDRQDSTLSDHELRLRTLERSAPRTGQ